MFNSLPESKYESESQVNLSLGDTVRTPEPAADEFNLLPDQLPSPTRLASSGIDHVIPEDEHVNLGLEDLQELVPRSKLTSNPPSFPTNEFPSSPLDSLPMRGVRRKPSADRVESSLGPGGWEGEDLGSGAVSPPLSRNRYRNGGYEEPPSRSGAVSPPLPRNRYGSGGSSGGEITRRTSGGSGSEFTRRTSGSLVSGVRQLLASADVWDEPEPPLPDAGSEGSPPLNPMPPPARFPPAGGQCPFSAISAGFSALQDESPPRSPLTKRLTRDQSAISLSSRGSALPNIRRTASRGQSTIAPSASRRGGKQLRGKKGKKNAARTQAPDVLGVGGRHVHPYAQGQLDARDGGHELRGARECGVY